ncbi:MAG: amidase family protein [Patescibacteria group bacterium]|nr:aspartyl/glutamyl-tRNA amidotransferase subunit A [Patescibacteria group bacterium]
MKNKLYSKTIHEVSDLLKSKKISTKDIIDETKENIDMWESKICAFITLCDFSGSRIQKGRLAGIPFSVKDNLSTKNILTTVGSKILENYTPPYDATVVDKCKSSGAVIVGKTNMDEFGHGFTTETSAFKTTLNPWDLKRLPGGSSGGAAAAVACGMGLFALATENLDSLRMPAAVCGVVGLKPTYGRCSRYGIIAMASSLECPGVIARNVNDAALILSIIEGKDEKDANSISTEALDLLCLKANKKQNFRIGYSRNYLGDGIDPAVKSVFEKQISALSDQGFEILEVEIPDPEAEDFMNNIIYRSEVSSNLARYDGIRFGYSANDVKDSFEQYYKTRSAFSSEVKRQIVTDTLAVEESEKLGRLYIEVQKLRGEFSKKWDRLFKNVDVLISPSAPNLALPVGFGKKSGFIGGVVEKKTADEGKGYMRLQGMYSVPAVLYGFPAISIPIRLSEGGLPIGINIFADRFEEEKMLCLAKFIEETVGFRGLIS